MKLFGFLSEYNPLHTGHAFHLRESLEKSGADACVCILSGPFVQRGEPALTDPWVRAEAARAMGCDLVVLLPTVYSLQPAQWFARSAMALITRMGCTAVSFGSPVTDMEVLWTLSDLLEEEPPCFQEAFRNALSRGLSYPAARAQALEKILPAEQRPAGRAVLGNANSTLGLHYLQALRQESYAGEVFAVERKPGTASATALRRKLRRGESDWGDGLPEAVRPLFRAAFDKGLGPVFPESLGPALTYLLRLHPEAAGHLPDDGEGMGARLAKAARAASGWEGVLSAAKTRRYTRTRLQRAALHALLGLTLEENLRIRKTLPLYVYPLALSEKGRALLSDIKSAGRLHVVDRPAAFVPDTPEEASLWALEQRAFDLYAMLLPDQKASRAGSLFTRQALRM